eukprot:scaffold1900_cov183-Ochromonas_danica.AAC.3
MRLDVTCMRYLTKDDYRVLTAVEMGMRNHEMVPVPLITSIARLRHGGSYKILSTLLRYKLVAHALQEYDGYRLSYLGYDILSLHALLSRGVIQSVGNQIGIGKESDIFEALDHNGNEVVIKIHRLGRTSFRAVRKNRDYLLGKSKTSWLYMSRLAATKEFAFMKALYAHDFPVPIPIDQNRHIVVMSRVPGFPMAQIKSGRLEHAENIFQKCLAILRRLVEHGLVHCDFNEFNLMVHDDSTEVTLIDFPQMVSTSHVNAAELLERDIAGLIKFFSMKMKYLPPDESYFRLEDVIAEQKVRIDEEVQASGFNEADEEMLLSIHQSMVNNDNAFSYAREEAGENEGGEVDSEGEEGGGNKEVVVEGVEGEGEEVEGEGGEEEEEEGVPQTVFDDFKEKRLADAYSKLRGEIIQRGKGVKSHLKGRNATKKRNKYGKCCGVGVKELAILVSFLNALVSTLEQQHPLSPPWINQFSGSFGLIVHITLNMNDCFHCLAACCTSFLPKQSHPSPCGKDNTTKDMYRSSSKESTLTAGYSSSVVTYNEIEVDLSHFSRANEVLGIGGFGLVRKAIKLTGQDRGRTYAMKTTAKASVLARSTGLQAMMTELKTLIILEDCEHICQLHYAFQDSTHLYYILDYAMGGDMRYNMRRSANFRFSEGLAKIFIKQIFMALQHCHEHNILHRDIKPENILLYSSGKVSLSDFGVAKILPDIEACKSTSGTHGYMAPEIYTKEHTHGTAFDWFATGITLFEFLTGRRPFEAAKLQRYHVIVETRRASSLTTAHMLDQQVSNSSNLYGALCGLDDYPAVDNEFLNIDDLRPSLQITNECQNFISCILHPNAEKRLGARGNIQSITSHLWLSSVELQPYPLGYICNQLPHFEISLKAQLTDCASPLPPLQSSSTQLIYSKINMSQGEAQVAVRQHLQAGSIAEDAQVLFKHFEYNLHNEKRSSSPVSRKYHSSNASSFDQSSLASLSAASDGGKSGASGRDSGSTGLGVRIRSSSSSSSTCTVPAFLRRSPRKKCACPVECNASKSVSDKTEKGKDRDNTEYKEIPTCSGYGRSYF